MSSHRSKIKSPNKTTRSSRPQNRTKRTAAEHSIEIIARGALFDRSRVLLCQNVKHGYYYLPGGHVEFSESAGAALVREFLEECGIAIRVGNLALVSEGVFDTKKRAHHELNLVFHVEHAGKSLPKRVKSRESGIAFAWLDIANVPDCDVRPLAAKAWLASGGPSAEHAEWVSEVTKS